MFFLNAPDYHPCYGECVEGIHSLCLTRAQAIDTQVKAYGGAQYRVIQEVVDKLSDAIKNSSVDIVPETVVNMGGNSDGDGNGSSTVLDTLLKFITIEKLGVSIQNPPEVTVAYEMPADAEMSAAEPEMPAEASK